MTDTSRLPPGARLTRCVRCKFTYGTHAPECPGARYPQVAQVVFIEEGDYWVAYYADPQMVDRFEVARIRRGLVMRGGLLEEASVRLKEQFQGLVEECVLAVLTVIEREQKKKAGWWERIMSWGKWQHD